MYNWYRSSRQERERRGRWEEGGGWWGGVSYSAHFKRKHQSHSNFHSFNGKSSCRRWNVHAWRIQWHDEMVVTVKCWLIKCFHHLGTNLSPWVMNHHRWLNCFTWIRWKYRREEEGEEEKKVQVDSPVNWAVVSNETSQEMKKLKEKKK